jgi:hypothetical protein
MAGVALLSLVRTGKDAHMRFGGRRESNLPAVVTSVVMAACLAGLLYSQTAFSARFLVTPDDGYWELDGDYGSEVADKDHDKRTLLSDDVTWL